MQKNLTIVIAVLLVIGGLWLIADKALIVVAQKTRNEAVQGCMEVSSYTFNNGKGVVTKEPIETAVIKCMQLKGLK